jgi:hypothetical protein
LYDLLISPHQIFDGVMSKARLPQLSSYSSAIERKNPGWNEDRDIPKPSFRILKTKKKMITR